MRLIGVLRWLEQSEAVKKGNLDNDQERLKICRVDIRVERVFRVLERKDDGYWMKRFSVERNCGKRMGKI